MGEGMQSSKQNNNNNNKSKQNNNNSNNNNKKGSGRGAHTKYPFWQIWQVIHSSTYCQVIVCFCL